MKLALIVLTFPIVYAIIGGQSVKDKWESQHISYEYIVSLQRNRQHFCSGVIYNLRRILTTASCVDDKNANEISVFTSNRFLNGIGERFGVNDIILKKPFGPRRVKDNIAFLVTNGEMFLNSDRQWAPIQEESLDKEMNVTIFGWGEGKIDSPEISNVLMSQSTTTITVKECKKYNVGVDLSNICVRSNENSGPCSYDEGGPLMSTNSRVLGIATPDLSVNTPAMFAFLRFLFNYNDFLQCGSDTPDVYTQLSAHWEWIHENDGSKIGVNIAIIVIELLILVLYLV